MSEFRGKRIRRWSKIVLFAGLVVGIASALSFESGKAQKAYVPPPPSDPVGAKYYSISPYAREPIKAPGDPSPWTPPFIMNERGALWLTTSAAGFSVNNDYWFSVAVNLPHGAVVWGWRAWVTDGNAAGQIAVGISCNSPAGSTDYNTFTNLGPRQSSGIQYVLPGQILVLKQLALTTTPYPTTINNRDFNYVFKVMIQGGSVEFRGAHIIYTMPAGS